MRSSVGSLDGKIALVTGASSGIGEAASRQLASARATVIMAARRAERLQRLADEIAANGGSAQMSACDVSNETAVERMTEKVIAEHGRIDILINSASIIDAGGIEKLSLDQWRRVIDVNLMGTIYACKFAVPVMKDHGAGDIINISSTAGRRAAVLMGAYSTSKFGLTGFTEGLRQELGESGIRVALIEPGATQTEVHRSISDPDWQHSMKEHISGEGVMQPEDIADAIGFILALPRRANVSQILIRPTDDTAPF